MIHRETLSQKKPKTQNPTNQTTSTTTKTQNQTEKKKRKEMKIEIIIKNLTLELSSLILWSIAILLNNFATFLRK